MGDNNDYHNINVTIGKMMAMILLSQMKIIMMLMVQMTEVIIYL